MELTTSPYNINNGVALPFLLSFTLEECSVLDSESSSSVSNPDQGHCVEFLCKTLTSHSASFSPTKVILQRGTLGFAELL